MRQDWRNGGRLIAEKAEQRIGCQRDLGQSHRVAMSRIRIGGQICLRSSLLGQHDNVTGLERRPVPVQRRLGGALRQAALPISPGVELHLVLVLEQRARFGLSQLEDLDSTIPATFAVYSDVVAAGLSRHRLGALVLVVFGLVSLTLAAVGTYGLMSFSVNQRFNEIAVRSAFGAERASLLKMFIKRALRLSGVGIVLGVVGAVAMRQLVASQLYETSALDPWVLALVPLTMLAVTLLASYVPARRASRIDVNAALREN